MPNPNVEERRAGALLEAVAQALRRTYPHHPHMEIEEATAEALCRFYEISADPARVPLSPVAWAFTVATNLLRAEHRRTHRLVHRAGGQEGEVPIVELLEGGRPGDELAATERIRALLGRLRPAVAEVIWLHDVEGWKPSEIAATLGCTANAINLRIKRGRRLLLRLLQTEQRDS